MNTLSIILIVAALGANAAALGTAFATQRVLTRYRLQVLCGPPGPMGATGSTGPQGPQGEPGTSISCACPGTETIPVDYINPVDMGYNIPPHTRTTISDM